MLSREKIQAAYDELVSQLTQDNRLTVSFKGQKKPIVITIYEVLDEKNLYRYTIDDDSQYRTKDNEIEDVRAPTFKVLKMIVDDYDSNIDVGQLKPTSLMLKSDLLLLDGTLVADPPNWVVHVYKYVEKTL